MISVEIVDGDGMVGTAVIRQTTGGRIVVDIRGLRAVRPSDAPIGEPTAAEPEAPREGRDLLFIDDVAQRLRRSPNQIRWMIQNGTAPTHAKIGGRVCFRASDVEAYIDELFHGSHA